MSDSLRCFIAVKMPVAAVERLTEAQQRLRAAEPDWKWVNPEMFHITLKFLGQVERRRLEGCWREAQEALGEAQRFSVAVKGLGVFPSLRAPRVAWAGISEGAEELASIAAKVEAVCNRHGFEREKRPFAAHLTLGRARQARPSSALTAAVDEFGEVEFGSGTVDRVLLMQSTLRPTGASYTAIGEQSLRDGEGA
ncbi:MAG: RNA 2',3'-cyclic phosphodiesterase [Armatimonadota bacterium]